MELRASLEVDRLRPVASDTYVLVHGAYHGGWCWKHVAALLRAQGCDVHTPTLTGLGERSHLLGCRPTLDTFIEDVAQLLRYEDLTDVILVGHSFAGPVISGVADRMPERLRHLVYLDAQILLSGESSADRSPERIETYRARAEPSGGVSVPPGTPEYFGIRDPASAAWAKPKLSPHPLQTYYDKLWLEHPVGNGVSATYIACSEPLFPNTAEARDRARSLNWPYLEIPTGHDAMISMPIELTDMLTRVGRSTPAHQAA